MITRKETNHPDSFFYQVIIDSVTDVHYKKIQAVVYPNYCDRVRLKINEAGIGMELNKDNIRNLIEVLNASLLAIE